jgi:hypothetical protein
MARIAGVTIERNAYGTPKYVRIDLKRYASQLADFFKANNIEVEKSPYSRKFVEKIECGERDIREGKTYKIDLENLWK